MMEHIPLQFMLNMCLPHNSRLSKFVL